MSYTVTVIARPGRRACRSACVDQRVFMPERLSAVRLSLSLTTLSSQCILWRTVRSSSRHCHRFRLLSVSPPVTTSHALRNSLSSHDSNPRRDLAHSVL